MKNTEQKKKREAEEKRQEVRAGIGGAMSFALATGACAGLGAFAGAALYFYKYALTPSRHDPRRDKDPMQKDYADGRRWMNEHPMREDIYLRAGDGMQLHANLIPAPAAEPEETGRPGQILEKEHRYAVCVHGYADSAEGAGLYARVYRDRYGMNVLLPDLRGHGGSDGDYVGMGLDDSLDLLCWIDWILERDPAAQIILHGISMGAAAILLTTGHTLPKQVAAAVADSSYTTAMKELESLYKTFRQAVVPAPVMLEAVRAITLVRAGYDLAKAAPLQAVARSKTPTLFIHGQEDRFVPPAMMTALYRAAACPKSFQWIPEAGHVMSAVVDPETYWARVERFLHAQGISLM